jgi:four helix bundle protein
MFLQLNHQKLDVFVAAKSFTLECCKFTKSLPSEEKFNMVQQVRRAALSVYLNIAEGCSRKSVVERKRFFEISRGSIIEIDAVSDLCEKLNYNKKENLQSLGEYMQRTFSMLTKMID